MIVKVICFVNSLTETVRSKQHSLSVKLVELLQTSYGTGYRLGILVSGIGTPMVNDNSKNSEKPSEDTCASSTSISRNLLALTLHFVNLRFYYLVKTELV